MPNAPKAASEPQGDAKRVKVGEAAAARAFSRFLAEPVCGRCTR